MAEDDELEEMRRKKLLEMQQQLALQEAQQEAYKAQEQALEEQKKAILRQVLTPEARERLGRLRMVKPELVENVEMQIIYLVESGRLRQVIDDATLKEILQKLQSGQRKEFRIEYK